MAVACYIGYYLYDSWKNPFRTSTAQAVTVANSVECSGYVVRDEKTIWVDAEYFSFEADDGQKVSTGHAVAAIYDSEAAYARAGQRRELMLQRDSIARIISDGGSRASIYEQMITLSGAARSGDSEALEGAALSLQTLLLSGGADLQAMLDDIDSRIAAIDAASRDDTEYLPASQAGLFSSFSDGYERVGTDRLAGLYPGDLSAVFSTAAPGDAKLVTGIGWCYAAVLDYELTLAMQTGGTVLIGFDSLSGTQFEMEVSSIGSPDNSGRCVVVFSSQKDIDKVLRLREEHATVVLSSFSGVSIPEEAILRDKDGDPFIYVISGLQARKVEIEVISVTDGVATVRSDDRLLVGGAQIIVQASELYDGKVVG